MTSSFFFSRLVPNRPDFGMSMTPDEQAAMLASRPWVRPWPGRRARPVPESRAAPRPARMISAMERSASAVMVSDGLTVPVLPGIAAPSTA